jgi:hypothetical protein
MLAHTSGQGVGHEAFKAIARNNPNERAERIKCARNRTYRAPESSDGPVDSVRSSVKEDFFLGYSSISAQFGWKLPHAVRQLRSGPVGQSS